MAGFLIGRGGPHAFDATGVVFGVGYLVVICVHLLLFTQAGVGRALWWLGAYNFALRLLVVAGRFADGLPVPPIETVFGRTPLIPEFRCSFHADTPYTLPIHTNTAMLIITGRFGS